MAGSGQTVGPLRERIAVTTQRDKSAALLAWADRCCPKGPHAAGVVGGAALVPPLGRTAHKAAHPPVLGSPSWAISSNEQHATGVKDLRAFGIYPLS